MSSGARSNARAREREIHRADLCVCHLYIRVRNILWCELNKFFFFRSLIIEIRVNFFMLLGFECN